ncbi:hypothetical protein BKA64DRAFT_698396 [Cadophora sp. MPI-SDFR-AT-0126]|nr:hypothetical protein BKA64DRAFT_698396 [Leotiomycetes sp. MPI-SDFR-AT-0126]
MSLWKENDYGVIADQACWALFAVTTFIVSLRLLCRVHVVPILLLTCILITIGSHHGLGRRTSTLEPEEIVQALKWNVIISSILIWSFSLPKFAIIATLKRILDYGRKTTIACILATSVWWFVQCQPVEYGWNRSIGGTRAPISVLADLGYFTSAYSALLDIFFALYPIPLILRLNMPLKSRVAVSIALGLSVLACIVSIYKLAIFGQVFEILAVDPIYPVPYLDILGVAEGAILLICASLPALGPLFRHARQSLSSRGGNSTTHAHQRGSRSHERDGNERNASWAKFKGHKLEDPERASASTSHNESVDAVPLVEASKRNFVGRSG